MSIGMTSYTAKPREPRKICSIRLNEDDLRKVDTIMMTCGVPDFSKCIRFLIQQGFDSLTSTRTVTHD